MIRSERVYSALADYYDTVVLAWSGAANAASFYVQSLPLSSDAHITVLDVGCGTGLYALAILERFSNAHVWAFDSNTAMVEKLRIKVQTCAVGDRIHTFVADMTKPLPIPSDIRFDLIVASGVLEYGNLADIVHNLMPYLQPGGYFFDAAIQDTLPGRLLAAFWGCKASLRQEILDAFQCAQCVRVSMPQLPPSYVLLRHIKEAYLFKKPV